MQGTPQPETNTQCDLNMTAVVRPLSECFAPYMQSEVQVRKELSSLHYTVQ